MNAEVGAGCGRSRRPVLSRMSGLAVAFAASFGTVATATSMVSPWSTVVQELDVILVEEGCQLSELAAVCLHETPRGSGERPSAVAVPVTMEGEFSSRTCGDVRAVLMATGDFSTRVSVWALPEDEWCRRLADDAREWLLAHGKERWPTFVHDGEVAGVGLLSEHFEAVGEPEAGARLHECIDGFMKQKLDTRRM